MRRDRLDIGMPIGKLKRAKDILPSPEELIAAEQTVKVTLRLSARSIKLFKHYAEKYHTKYQKIIRRLLDAYTEIFAASR